MTVERSGQAIDVETIMGQLETGGARRFWRRAAALIRWHEPDESRGSSPEFCEGLGVKFPGPTRLLVLCRFHPKVAWPRPTQAASDPARKAGQEPLLAACPGLESRLVLQDRGKPHRL